MKPKVLFAGIDGSGKTTCMDLVLKRMDPRYHVLRIGVSGPELVAGGRGEKLISPAAQRRIRQLGARMRRVHLYGVFLIFHFTYKFLFARWFEIFQEADLVVYETDTLLHPAAVLTYHFPLARRVSPGWRLRLLGLVFASRKTSLRFYLDVTPETAVQRIERREREEGLAAEPHENLDDLRALRAEFEELVTAAEEIGYRIVRIDVNDKDPDAVRDEIERSLASFLPDPPTIAR